MSRAASLPALVLVLGLAGVASPASAQTIVPIADIQANPLVFLPPTTVTVEGRVYIPANYAGPGSTPAAYVQDTSGHGINVGVDNAALNTVGNVVRLAGEVQLAGATVKILNATVQQLGSGATVVPVRLPTGAAADGVWEGTHIEVHGNVTAVTGSNNKSYTVDDGSGPIVVHVLGAVGAPTLAVGNAAVARGAGSRAGTTYQVEVGRAADLALDPGGADAQAPALAGGWAQSAASVRVTFSEAVGAASGQTAANYRVYPVASPGSPVTISQVAAVGPVATLQLGASLPFGADYVLRVAGVQDLAGNPMAAPDSVTLRRVQTDTTPPTLVSAAATAVRAATATFSEPIDPASGGTAGNYEVHQTSNPINTVAVSTVSVAGAVATLTLGADLAPGTNYTLQAQNVQDLAGNPMVGTQTGTFTTSGCGNVIPIASIQADTLLYRNQVVTVQGQVYIPNNYRSNVSSGYIQDSSNRGINIFGTTPNNALLQDVGNIVCVTGTVQIYQGTTVEVTNITSVNLISGGNPPLQPTHLGTGAAAAHQWEGTFIEVSGPVTAVRVTGTTTTFHNYTVNDGTGPVIVRVADALSAPVFAVGQTITGRGAGSFFSPDFQILVGKLNDVFEGGGGPDTTPPSLQSATNTSATSVRASFSEAISTATGNVASNHEVFETANTSNTLAVTAASASGATATLTLGAALTNGVQYTLRAHGIADLSSNVMPAPQSVNWTPSSGPTITPIADIQADTLGFKGRVVTVEGQVYIPSNYRSNVTSGYIQDTSNRGINIFGSTPDNAALQNMGNIVRVTGKVEIFSGTTVEITSVSAVTIVSSGNTPLQPRHLSTGAASSHQWEGTYVEVTGPITAVATTGTTAVFHNYTVNDGSGSVVVRVPDSMGASTFTVGQSITGAGAGSYFSPNFQILVGKISDIRLSGGGPDTTPPTLTRATATSATAVDVTFSETVTSATAAVAGNYAVYETATPGNTFAVGGASLSSSRLTATLSLGGSLTEGRNYTVRVNNVKDDAGNTIALNSTVAFLYTAGGVIPIAAIQADTTAYVRQVVTVEGQVYIPSNYRGSVTSGYIQDGSGRGINIFGSTPNNAALQDTTAIVRVKGTVQVYGGTTVELLSVSAVTLVSSGNPILQPTPLSTRDAASSAWEGTYIQVTGTILSVATTGTAPSAFHNYTVSDGSGAVIVRVPDALVSKVYQIGQIITGRGAGSKFSTDYQILVGRRSGIFEGQAEDTFPPAVLSALATGPQELVLTFNEAVSQSTAEVPGNYSVFRTNQSTTTVAVTSAHLDNSTTVRLGLAEAFDPSAGFSVKVINVADLNGNAIPAAGVTHAIVEAPTQDVAVQGPPFTFLPRRGERYPITWTVPSEVAGGQGDVLLRIFDLQGRLQKTLYDSRFPSGGGYTNNRATLRWDGRDDTAALLPAGTYIVHLLVTRESDGKRLQAQMPVVVATRLDR